MTNMQALLNMRMVEEKDELVLFCFRLDVTDLLGDLLEGVLVG